MDKKERGPQMKKFTSVFLFLLLSVYPLWLTGTYRTLENDKYPVFLVLCGAMTLAALVCLAVRLAKKEIRLSAKRIPVFAYFAPALFLMLTVSALVSPYKPQVWLGGQRRDGLVTWFLYLGIFFAAASRGRLTRVHDAALAVCLLFTAVLGFLQRLNLNPLGLYPEEILWRTGGKGFMATIGNVDLLSAFAALGGLLLFGRYTAGKDRLRWIPLAGAACGGLVLLLAGAEAGRLGAIIALLCGFGLAVRRRAHLTGYFFGLFVCVAAMALLSLFHRQRTGSTDLLLCYPTAKTLRRALIAAAFLGLSALARYLPAPAWILRHKKGCGLAAFFAVLAAAACTVFFFGNRFGGGMTQIHAVLHGIVPDRLGSGRLRIWRQALALVKERPLFGSGPDTMGLRTAADHAHSIFLNLAVNGGILSLLPFCGLIGAVLVPAVRSEDAEAAALMLPVLAYLAQAALTVDEFIVAPLFWAVFGLLAGQAVLRAKNNACFSVPGHIYCEGA